MGKNEAASGPWGLSPGGRASGMVHRVKNYRIQCIAGAGRSNIELRIGTIKNIEEGEWGDGRWGAPERRRPEVLLKKLIILF
jgi:hypothetical protein